MSQFIAASFFCTFAPALSLDGRGYSGRHHPSVLYEVTGDQARKKNLVKWIVICFSSILMFIFAGLFSMVISRLSSTFGIDTIGSTGIKLPRQNSENNSTTPLGGSGIVLPRKN